MYIHPTLFDSIDQAIVFAKQIARKLPESTLIGNLPSIFRSEFLKNPYSGFENNAPDDRFIVCRLASKRFSLKPNLREHRFLYRGQTKYYKDCAPSLFRNREQDYFIEEMVRGDEQQLLMLTHPLVRLLDHGIELGGNRLVFEMNLYGLTQHYYNKTNFIDLTSDILVSAFFATNKYDSSSDSYVPISEGIGCLYLYELKEDIDFKFTPLSTIGLQVFPRSSVQRGFLYRMEKGQNFNDVRPLRILKFKHRRNVSEKYYKMFDGGQKLFPNDILTHHWLLYNKNPKVISRVATRFNAHWNRHLQETEEGVAAKLTQRGFTIKDYTPSFTAEELYKYYFSKHDIWDEFCAKIYFPGGDNEEFHRQLADIKNRPEYRWAFDEDTFRNTDLSKINGYLYDKYMSVLN